VAEKQLFVVRFNFSLFYAHKRLVGRQAPALLPSCRLSLFAAQEGNLSFRKSFPGRCPGPAFALFVGLLPLPPAAMLQKISYLSAMIYK
jgi:hypothetical protein